MTAVGFQSALARMIVDPGYRDALRRGMHPGLGDVTGAERMRLSYVAQDPGLDITITLYQAWRLTKVLSLLPLTCRALGDERAAKQLRAFWARNPARSLYFVGECIAFCAHLEGAIDTTAEPMLHDALSYERARLELRDEIAHGANDARRTVRLSHEPNALFGRLRSSAPAKPVPRGTYVLIGTLTPANDERWEVVALEIEFPPDANHGGVQWQTIASRPTTSARSPTTRAKNHRADRSTASGTSSAFGPPDSASDDPTSATSRSSRLGSPRSEP